MYLYWQKVTDIVDEVARQYSIDDAIALAERLKGMNDERIVRILGDYEGEPVFDTSIKGMLNRILNVLQVIDAKLETVEYNVEAISDKSSQMLKYGSNFRSTPSEFAQNILNTMLHAYRFRSTDWVNREIDEIIFEARRPEPVRFAEPHTGVLGNFVRIPQNAMLGLEPQVVHSFKVMALVYGDFINPPWNTVLVDLYSQPVDDTYYQITTLSPSVRDPNKGFSIYWQQLNYLNPSTDYIWAKIRAYVPTDDWAYPWFSGRVVEWRLEQYAGQVLE